MPCRTPFADLPFVPKMHAICNPQHRVSFPELANKDLMHVMQRCLDRDPKTRITLQVRMRGTAQPGWWLTFVLLRCGTLIRRALFGVSEQAAGQVVPSAEQCCALH